MFPDPEVTNWNFNDPSATGKIVTTYEPKVLQGYFVQDAAAKKTTWKDSSASAPLVGNTDLKVTYKFTNNVGVSREYSTTFIIKTPEAPFMPGFDSSGTVKLITD